MNEKKQISNELLQFVNGGTEQELGEMYEYIHRKFPEFDNLPREDAIATALLVYLPINRAQLSNYAPPETKNYFIMEDGTEVGVPEVMVMLKERYGD